MATGAVQSYAFEKLIRVGAGCSPRHDLVSNKPRLWSVLRIAKRNASDHSFCTLLPVWLHYAAMHGFGIHSHAGHGHRAQISSDAMMSGYDRGRCGCCTSVTNTTQQPEDEQANMIRTTAAQLARLISRADRPSGPCTSFCTSNTIAGTVLQDHLLRPHSHLQPHPTISSLAPQAIGAYFKVWSIPYNATGPRTAPYASSTFLTSSANLSGMLIIGL